MRLRQQRLLDALNDTLRVQDPATLSRGRDVREPGSYDSLKLAAAWRIENPLLWDKYSACPRPAPPPRLLASQTAGPRSEPTPLHALPQ